jgi:chromosome partitioning protein
MLGAVRSLIHLLVSMTGVSTPMNLPEFIAQSGPLFAALGAIATVLGVAFGFYKASHNRHVNLLKDQINQLQHQLGEKPHDDPESSKLLINQLRQQITHASESIGDLEAERESLKDGLKAKESALATERARAREIEHSLTEELVRAREEQAKWAKKDKAGTNRIRKALQLEGRFWELRILCNAPPFRALHERRSAIISVLNLKGGVGKTTVTAHLGAALALRGYRVLLDLDLQGSLSTLFVNESELADRSSAGKLLQHFLIRSAVSRTGSFLDYTVPIIGGESAVVPTADTLAYAELNLTMQWLLRIGKKDTRFLLRKALHQQRVAQRFDVVLLDCPPIFNTCCVNALAASDYILIPVLPSQKAAERVPLLLQRVKRLGAIINPELQVAGVLLNRTHGVKLTGWEQDLWKDVLERSKDQWKLPVYGFETRIRQTTEVRANETEFSPPLPGSELHALFGKLAQELEVRLPRDCCRTATPAH